MKFFCMTVTEAPELAKVKPSSKLVAPVWHTAIMLFLWLAPSYWLIQGKHLFSSRSPLWLAYTLQLAGQWILFLILLTGLMIRGTRLRDLTGAGWTSWKSFLKDARLGGKMMLWNVGITIVLAVLLLRFLGSWGRHSPPDYLSPHRFIDLLGFIPIACTAGFTEEVAFRGYLQRQISALTGRPVVALVFQAIVFSVAHGPDEPIFSLFAKFIFGVMFGVLAIMRRSLLPGILGHSFQDCLAGLLSVLTATLAH